MYPTLLKLGPLQIHSYGLMIAMGVAIAVALVRKNAGTVGFPGDLAVDLALAVVFFGFIGARIFFVVLQWDYFRSTPLEIFEIWKGGVVYYGGLIAGFLTVYVFSKWKHVRPVQMFDLLLPVVALVQGFGRIGCFLNGCCYGKESYLPWAVKFPFLDYPVHPTQLYESVFCFLLAFALYQIWKRKMRPGWVTGLYFYLYAFGRFVIEFFRGDHGDVWIGLTRPQLISLVVMAVSFLFLIRLFRHGIQRDRRSF